MALCNDCQRIDLFKIWHQMCLGIKDGDYTDESATFVLKDNFRALESSSTLCTLCKILWDALLASGVDGRYDISDPVVLLFPRGDYPDSSNRLPSYSNEDGIWALESIYVKFRKGSVRVASMHVTEDKLDNFSTIISGRISISTNRLDFVKQWNERCRQEHAVCNQAANAEGMPTRMLLLQRQIVEANPLVQVVPAPANKEFISLSHCWGLKPIIRLTRATYSHYHECVPWHELSRTFQNAIEMALDLGFSYLWIDSLCIIQDDTADWEREAAVMGSVYANAVLNIMASSSKDGAGGCHPADLHVDHGCKLSISDSNHRYLGNIAVLPMTKSLVDITVEPLSTRGWVLQERLMSRRKVYCTENQFIWSCCEAVGVETGIINSSFELVQQDDKLFYGISEDLHRHGHPQKFFWADTLRSFSLRNLTYASDKLPALSGLAQIVAKRSGWTYAAGLWQEWLPEGLLWYALEPSAPQPNTYTGPSWSWVAIDGPINISYSVLNDTSFRSALKDLRVEIDLVGIDPFGRISSASLQVVGNVKRATFGEKDPSSNAGRSLIMDELCHIATSNPDGRPEVGEECFCLYLGSVGCEDMAIEEDIDDEMRVDDEDSFEDDFEDDFNVGRSHYFLILKRTGKHDEFMRIGQGKLMPGCSNWFDDAETIALTIV